MSFLIAAPELVSAAATDLANVGSSITRPTRPRPPRRPRWSRRAPTRCRRPSRRLFGAHAQAYQALSAQAAIFHQQFVQALNSGAATYAAAEAANASPLQALEQGALAAINAPVAVLIGAR